MIVPNVVTAFHAACVAFFLATVATAEGESLLKRAVCGPGIGSCPPGACCSASGWCGTTTEYCEGSQCQLEYSDSCDTFFGPSGPSTEKVSRPRVGNVPYGTIITKCSIPGTMALTFDDGPFVYTNQMLDLLDKLNVKATFFVAGNNRGKGHIDDPVHGWDAILRRTYRAGHQIASHTWTHRDLNKVNRTIQWSEMIFNEMAFRNIFGFFPTYMRPPYLECSADSGCVDVMATLGYHIVTNNIDTKDYANDSPELIQNSKSRFDSQVSPRATDHSYIVLAHDVHFQTVANLTEHMVRVARERGYKLVPVGECLGDPRENWYRTMNEENAMPSSTKTSMTPPKSKTGTPPRQTLTVSPNQRCGGSTGYTCQGSFGNCCSFYGYCGSDAGHCGTGCDVDFGSCNPRSGGLSDTTNGLCGASFGATCVNYGTKTCCSAIGYCGNSDEYCGEGCQPTYGRCD